MTFEYQIRKHMSEEHTYFLDKYICIVTHLDCWLIFHEVVNRSHGHASHASRRGGP